MLAHGAGGGPQGPKVHPHVPPLTVTPSRGAIRSVGAVMCWRGMYIFGFFLFLPAGNLPSAAAATSREAKDDGI